MIKLFIMLMAIPIMGYGQSVDQKTQELPPTKTEITFTAAELQKYAGEYLKDNLSITLNVEGNKLFGLAQGDAEKIEFTPLSSTQFFIKGPDIEVEFQFEEDQVVYMLVKMKEVQKLKKVL